MRGSDERTVELFSYVDLEERVPRRHRLRLIRRIVNQVLAALDREFAELYATDGRPSIAPERLLRALLLQVLHNPLGTPVDGATADTADFVADMRDLNLTPHVAQNVTNRDSAINHRTTRHRGYEISQQKRKRVEEPFEWGKTIGGLARPMLRGVKKLDFKFTLTRAAYDLIKLPRLIAA
jgi:hypothetical protein